VNSKDTVAVVPFGGGYSHAGFQMTVEKNGCYSKASKPTLHYPNLKMSRVDWAKIAWKNSLPASLNLGYDHVDYSERLDLPRAREYLESLHFNSLYEDAERIGFELKALGPSSQEMAGDVVVDFAEE
jgi:hypothetical protein